MGNIYRKVKICGLTAEGKKRGCVETDALVDTGATTTVISEAIGRQLKVPNIRLGTLTTMNGHPVEIKLAGVELDAPSCGLQPMVIAVSDRMTSIAGRTPKDQNVQVILGHDYLQKQHAGLRYTVEGADEISCKPGKAKRKR